MAACPWVPSRAPPRLLTPRHILKNHSPSLRGKQSVPKPPDRNRFAKVPRVIAKFMPHRARSLNADCMTPHGTVLHQTLDFDEFIPPIPPPPYYPPEYTCTPVMETQRGLHLDFPHSPFSAIYGVPINSPGTLYPSELPPPYESIATTSLEQQATESSLCERNTTADFSTQEVADLPDHSCSSEDLCSLEVQGSLHSTSDLSPYGTLRTVPTDGSCTSLEHSARCSLRHQNHPPEPSRTHRHRRRHHRHGDDLDDDDLLDDGYSESSHTEDPSPDWSSENVSAPEREDPAATAGAVTVTANERSWEKATACSEHTAVVVSFPASSKPSFLGGKKSKEGAKVDIRLKPRPSHGVPGERPHSLADLKTYKDTKILVAKFLEHSSCSLPPEVQQVVNSIKFVIKSDERHMEEAIFSASIIDQVMTQSQYGTRSPRKRPHDELHLQSCGALSSPCTPPRRPRPRAGPPDLANPPGPPLSVTDRPHSLVSVCRETIL
ncbi:hypothetical protein JZ751_020490 [Albula glossodonta]|uniref:Uncharacterized protein n=1 Tax=Albula glossodonta TaxID=121402 RepID=A0A8T2PNJ9_9TELE|nr:hypothetical protein JZ751_020490 [Albula glossodonta]